MTHDMPIQTAQVLLMFAWTGPFIGALIRPIGGMIADKFGGARVTQYVSLVMVASALGVAYYMKMAYVSETPEEFISSLHGCCSWSFLLQRVLGMDQLSEQSPWFLTKNKLALFLVGHLRLLPTALSSFQKCSVKKSKQPHLNMLFMVSPYFTAVCVLINWWFYLRPDMHM